MNAEDFAGTGSEQLALNMSDQLNEAGLSRQTSDRLARCFLQTIDGPWATLLAQFNHLPKAERNLLRGCLCSYLDQWLSEYEVQAEVAKIFALKYLIQQGE